MIKKIICKIKNYQLIKNLNIKRWNSIYMMLSIIFRLQNQINDILKETKYSNYADKLLTETEFNKAEKLLGILEPLYSCTKLISGENYVSRSIIVPCVNELYRAVNLI